MAHRGRSAQAWAEFQYKKRAARQLWRRCRLQDGWFAWVELMQGFYELKDAVRPPRLLPAPRTLHPAAEECGAAECKVTHRVVSSPPPFALIHFY